MSETNSSDHNLNSVASYPSLVAALRGREQQAGQSHYETKTVVEVGDYCTRGASDSGPSPADNAIGKSSGMLHMTDTTVATDNQMPLMLPQQLAPDSTGSGHEPLMPSSSRQSNPDAAAALAFPQYAGEVPGGSMKAAQRGMSPPSPTLSKAPPHKSRAPSPASRSSAAAVTSGANNGGGGGGGGGGGRKRSGSVTSNSGGTPSQLRRGKWTVEEETYVARVIQDFNSGFLDAPPGTTLRTYLSAKLSCDPMRITKKFSGDACIGKRVFHPAVKSLSNAAAIEKAQVELEELEQRWRRRMEMQQSESAKKAAASAVVVAAAAVTAVQGATGNTSCLALCPRGACTCAPNLVRAAGWLERAKSSLTAAGNDKVLDHLSRDEIVKQMAQVQRLLNEGQPSEHISVPPEPALPTNISVVTMSTTKPAIEARGSNGTDDRLAANSHHKRLRSTQDFGSAEAEDAAALVNFLHSVQAAAAASQDGL